MSYSMTGIFYDESVARLQLAEKIGKLNDGVPNLKVVHYKTEKQIEHLFSTVVDWKEQAGLISAFQWVRGLASGSSKDDEILSSSREAICLLRPFYEDGSHYICVENLSGVILGVGEVTTEYDQLDCLVTAPSNLNITVNPGAMRGVGSMIVREWIRCALLNDRSTVWLDSFRSSVGFYERHGFTQVFTSTYVRLKLTEEEIGRQFQRSFCVKE